jgi:hypothetical protein
MDTAHNQAVVAPFDELGKPMEFAGKGQDLRD